MIALLKRMRAKAPGLYAALRAFAMRRFGRVLGVCPRPLGHELRAVSHVLYSAKWNMAYGKGLAHERLEADFCAFTGARAAVAVNTGGMALQMSMRALGLKPGDEVLLQGDTCSATAFAVMNAACTPIFCDIDPLTFTLLPQHTAEMAQAGARGLIATHMWGNPEDMAMAARLAAQRDMVLIEDACLALGTRVNGRMAGTIGKVGVFSFGCIKPIQGGEGGMIVTDDEALARELRSLRHWGDRTIDFGVRDTTQLAWNGRLSEIVAAVVTEQLRGYPAYLRDLRGAVADFAEFLRRVDGLDLVLGNSGTVEDCVFTQLVLRFDESRMGCTKAQFRDRLAQQGISSWHANFEPIPSLSFFRGGTWREWVLKGDMARIAANYHGALPFCQSVFDATGLGISKGHMLSASQRSSLKRAILSSRGRVT